MRKDISYMAEDLELIKERVRELEEKTEYAERYSRRENILIYGIKEEEKQFQDSKALVLKVLAKVSHKRNWDDRQIVRAHRLGQKKGDKHTRPLIVRFLHHIDKMYVLGKRDELKKLGLRVDQPWRKLTLQQHQHQPPPSPPRDNLEPNARQQRKSPAQLTRAAASTQRGSQNRHDLRLSAVQQQQTYATVPGGSPERSGTSQQGSPARASTRETAARAEPLTSPTNLDEPAQHLFTEGVRQGRPLTRSQQRREDSDEAPTGPTAAST
ncbi:hypothetical protein ElyMa_002576800 [Elysia marginata]|uniref:Uncharacterized protein n=1 Tax=Elysia marginata TaxID=1093978 RepID=A0AAV4H0T2_9GAST|nr:hypothetical protein ElyMa_002576800 [Elysia marginata]